MEKYTLDPGRISLQRFFELTRARRMIPSRVALHEQPEERFRLLEGYGIRDVGQLIRALGTKSKIHTVASATGIPESYLVLLKREAGSYLARPFPLSDLPGIPFEYSEALKSEGIRNTREFFEGAQTDRQQEELSARTGIPVTRLQEIWSLCDLSRITGVGALYARIIYHSGIRSVREFANTDPATHNKKYLQVVGKYGYPDQPLSEEDIVYCIDYANVILELGSNQFK